MAATCSGSKKIINGVNNAIYKDPTTEETTSIVLSPVTLSKLATTAEGNITFDVFEGTGGQTKEITIPAENLYSLEIGDLLNPSTETKIPDNFLKGCTNLTDIVLDGCTDVTEIGNDFMSGCENLAFFDLISTAPLYQVTKIGDNFMQGCKNLRSVSLYSCGKLQTVGKNFLDSCPTLIQLALPFGYGNDVQSVYPEPITIGEGAFGNNTFSRVGSTIYACGTNQAEAYKATTNKG